MKKDDPFAGGFSTIEPNVPPTVDLDGDDGPPADETRVRTLPPEERFVVEREIGRGGMGVVERARDVGLRRVVAIKRLRRDLPATGARLARFVAEAQLTAQLDHPVIVPVHDLGVTADGEVFYVMKLVRGRTLHEVLRCVRRGEDGAWTRRRLLRALLHACDGVAYAHARGVVHRDLKPGNLILGDFGEVCVLDWGVAALVDADPGATAVDAATDPGGAVGTHGYASPEQLAGRPVDARTDVYSLGAMLGEILTGRVPGDAALALRDAPEALLAVVRKATDPDPERRHPTVRAFAAAVEGWLERQERREADRLGWSRRNLELSALALDARAVRIADALSHLAELTRLLFGLPAPPADVDRWLAEAGFAVDADGYFQPLDLPASIRAGRAPPDALSWCWPPSRAEDAVARAHMYALRGIGPALRALTERVRDLTFVYYADARNVALVFPADDMRAAVPSEFDFLSYPAFAVAAPAANPSRALRTTSPHVDYGNKGLITAMSLPVHVGDAFVGVWAADVPLSVLHADVQLAGPDDETTVIVDANGLVIARSGGTPAIGPKGAVYTRTLADEGGVLARLDVARVFAEGAGVQRVADADGEVVVQYRVAPHLRWAICTAHHPADR